jgi:hypothetical protein
MKKFIVMSVVFAIAAVGNLHAQRGQMEIASWSWSASNATGSQTVQVPGGKGTLKFDRRGDKFTNVVFIDAAGQTFRMTPGKPTNGAPATPCKYPIPDACFATENKNIGMCMCKPTDLTSNGGGEYTITLLLPAVQKVRAAH